MPREIVFAANLGNFISAAEIEFFLIKVLKKLFFYLWHYYFNQIQINSEDELFKTNTSDLFASTAA